MKRKVNFLVHNFSLDFISLSIVIWFDAYFFFGGFSTFMLLDCIFVRGFFFPDCLVTQCQVNANNANFPHKLHCRYFYGWFVCSFHFHHFEWLAEKRRRFDSIYKIHISMFQSEWVFCIFACWGIIDHITASIETMKESESIYWFMYPFDEFTFEFECPYLFLRYQILSYPK